MSSAGNANNLKETKGLKHNYNEICEEMDQLNRQLEEMKEAVLSTSVRAHILEVELATMYSPEIASSLRAAQQDCGACRQEVYGMGRSSR